MKAFRLGVYSWTVQTQNLPPVGSLPVMLQSDVLGLSLLPFCCLGPGYKYCFYFFLSYALIFVLRGDWPVQFWSQNVPEQVFVFFQVWVPKHAYFSSKSVFLWYMFDFYANENILWTLVCLFLSCGRSFHWKNTPFHPLVTGTFYPKLSTCCLSKCSVASDLQNDVMTQWELPLMKAQMVWKGGKGIPTETS